MLVTEEAEVLFYLLILVLDFAVTFRMVGSDEPSLNSKASIESIYKSGSQ
jgi:hypothetical protein